MKLNLKSIQSKISKNFEFFFVLLLILISIIITQFYNSSKNIAHKEYIKIFNNIYFQKTVKNIFDNFSPKYLKIDHIVVPNESMSSILKKYDVSEKEANLIIKEIQAKLKKNTLKVNQKISFTINKEDNKISKLVFPVSKTRKLLFSRDFETGSFLAKDIVTNLNKKII